MSKVQLVGSPNQIRWATAIRENSLSTPGLFTDEQVAALSRINDSTWWIANRDQEAGQPVLSLEYKEPAPHQLEGGPPPPPRPAARTNQQNLDLTNRLRQNIRDMENYAGRSSPYGANDEPHEAELFAVSVSHIPLLAELALDATMSRLYVKANEETGKAMRCRVRQRLERARAELIAAIDKDLDGIRRILGKD